MPLLLDRFDRTIDYLRVSVTDRCNFRCVYCMPEEGFPCTPKEEHLSAEEFARIIGVAAGLGMSKVRFTGGEPLLRKDLPEIVRAARDAGVVDLSATTNGHRLPEMAEPLAAAGLSRVNISLDTLRPDRFTAIARRGSLEIVLEGIRAAVEAGLAPVKLNVVALRGINDDEAADFAAWTLREPVHVRFIEVMPMRWNLDEGPSMEAFSPHGGAGLLQIRQAPGGMLSDADMRRRFVPCEELMASIEAVHGKLEPADLRTNGPARTFRLAGAPGTVGFISQISNDLCSRCNRLRLTHDGFLRGCLMSDGELDLRNPIRSGATDEEIRALFEHVVAHKPERHYLAEGQRVTGRGMSQIGG
ncbi:GTP 3',8-cyclase MoaA [Fimbriimonas ginsengisoli]|uniref:GTP 3',8-cyclase n=1 Tax=Fimbriimonas ginsengisoli Gsoil 348 TaxID=661478 RepID=A0A068NUD3_FIMGI|nr:GTP 3',8-cyclase MoaA [Fimbriimonas ginsengisoli]AIE87123.1 Molybdenum cofactor biosynthesis protein MoaA [Fimbriimonas ginsengisoli Gsoil 348]